MDQDTGRLIEAIRGHLEHTRYIPTDTEAANALRIAIEQALEEIGAYEQNS